MNCLIVDNDIQTINKIKSYLNNYSNIVLNTSSEESEEALDKSMDDSLDVLFINLESKRLNILEFLLDIRNYWKDELEIVALSSKKKEAYLAYKYDLSDFLLKPVSHHAFKKSLFKLKKKLTFNCSDTICLRSNKDFRYLKTSEILFLKADNNTTDFYMTDGSTIGAYKTLKTYEDMLPENFLRIHRSYIINRNYITRIQFGNQTCTLKSNKIKLPFTKSFIDNINLINTFYSGLPELSN